MKTIPLLIVALLLWGCSPHLDSQAHWQDFSAQWKAGSIPERKRMVDIQAIHHAFQEKTADEVKQVFGTPTFEGEDEFGDPVLRYDFDPVPDTDGPMMHHLTFTMENRTVVRVEANLMTEN